MIRQARSWLRSCNGMFHRLAILAAWRGFAVKIADVHPVAILNLDAVGEINHSVETSTAYRKLSWAFILAGTRTIRFIAAGVPSCVV